MIEEVVTGQEHRSSDVSLINVGSRLLKHKAYVAFEGLGIARAERDRPQPILSLKKDIKASRSGEDSIATYVGLEIYSYVHNVL